MRNINLSLKSSNRDKNFDKTHIESRHFETVHFLRATFDINYLKAVINLLMRETNTRVILIDLVKWRRNTGLSASFPHLRHEIS